MRHGQQQLGRGFRPAPFSQLLEQLIAGAHWPQAQGNYALGLGEDAHRDHVFGLGTWIEVDSAQEQQHLRVRQRQQPRTGVFLKQQVAGKLVQTTVMAQPGTGLRVTTIPVQPQAFLRLQLKCIQLSSSNRTRTAVSIQHQGMYQAPLRVFFFEHPYPRRGFRGLLWHFQRAWRDNHTIVVSVNVFTGAEGHTGKIHHHVEVADATLVGLHRMAGQRLHAYIGLRQNIDVTYTAVDHQAFPVVLRGFFGKHVAQQRPT
ncbi:hypothetical protein D3C78_1069260 [compost metagenome]